MKRILSFGIILLFAYMFGAVTIASAQETITGNIIRYGSGRYTGVRTAFFTLTLNSRTPDDAARRYLDILKTDGQDKLLDEMRGEELGRFSLSGELGRTINAVREVNVNGKRKIYIVFERWTQFAEFRGGYRSLDYPFGYIELTIDPRTGKGSGKYFAAARIRWKTEKDGVASHVDVEDYATIPAKLLNVKVETGKP